MNHKKAGGNKYVPATGIKPANEMLETILNGNRQPQQFQQKPAILVDTLSVQLCRQEEQTIFVFGDNLIGKGTAGQAAIRYMPNTVGIPTKRLPSMAPNAFFSDQPDEAYALLRQLSMLAYIHTQGTQIAFPSAGLGTGMARMETKSPRLFNLMNEIIHITFGIDFRK